MHKIAIAVHGGASELYPHLKRHIQTSKDGMQAALVKAYQALKKGSSALDAVEIAVKILEDDPIFNAGRGSCLNNQGEIEMDASIMDGKSLMAGAVSMVRQVKNPITLARTIMHDKKHVLLSGYGALAFAKKHKLILKNEKYFITPHELQLYLDTHHKKRKTPKKHGTVGAVALDKKGNLAAATSTGGTPNCLPGRVGDSCIIGAGCYADNKTCAISGTGEGEFLIRGVVAHTIAMLMELKNVSLQKACDYVIHKRNKSHGEMGVIGIDHKGNIVASYNTEIMKRGWIDITGKMQLKV